MHVRTETKSKVIRFQVQTYFHCYHGPCTELFLSRLLLCSNAQLERIRQASAAAHLHQKLRLALPPKLSALRRLHAHPQ